MKTILIVEDIDLNIDLLTQLLEEEYALVVAKDGAEGVALAAEKRPDLIHHGHCATGDGWVRSDAPYPCAISSAADPGACLRMPWEATWKRPRPPAATTT